MPKAVIFVIASVLVLTSISIIIRNKREPSTRVQAPSPPSSLDEPMGSPVSKQAAPTPVEASPAFGEAPTESKAASHSAQTSPKPSSFDLDGFIYPNSLVKLKSQNKLELESSASPKQITDWYKGKIRDSNFNAKSFAQTTTNGNIFNKLSGAKPGEKIEITIKKDQNGSNTNISVDRL